MSRFVLLLVFTAVTAVLTGGLTALTQFRSVWSGVYSAEQAERGRRLYVRDCAQCHGESLLGAEAGPPVAGDAFLGRWDKKSVGALYDLVKTTMPEVAPGSLTERQYIDLVAYLLSENAFPAGKDELPGDVEAMKSILVVFKP